MFFLDDRYVGVVITDGRSNNARETWEEAVLLRESKDPIMIALGIGNNIRTGELEGIATTPTDEMVMRIDDFDSFDDIQNKLVDIICNSKSDIPT